MLGGSEMSDYKRLTKQAGWHKDIDLTDELGYSYIYQRLAEWENDYESGKVVKLPCKVGDTIWVVDGSWGHREDGTWGSTSEMHEGKVYSFTYYGNCLHVEDDFTSNCYLWGEDAFLTREEAEKRLEDLKNGRD
jgi:hypothetical protein